MAAKHPRGPIGEATRAAAGNLRRKWIPAINDFRKAQAIVREAYPKVEQVREGVRVYLYTEPGGKLITHCCLVSDAWSEAAELIAYGRTARPRL